MILTIIHRLFTAVLVLICVPRVQAQELEDLSLKHSMKQDGLSMQFTVLSPDKKGVRRHSAQKTYYWYKAQKVIGTQGGSSGYLLHGAFESQYASKQLCEKGSYHKGLKNGEWSYWYASGKLMRREHWKNGVQKGAQLIYNPDGTLAKTTVIRGRSSRTQTGDSLVELSGKSETITVYDSLGKTISVAHYKGHVLHGRQETWSADGKKTTTTFKNGELVVKEPKKLKETTEPSGTDTETKEGFFRRLKKRFYKKEKNNAKTRSEKERKKSAGQQTKPAGKTEKKTDKTETEPSTEKAKKKQP